MKAVGVLVDYDDPDGLHVWCKKRFLEYYLDYGEMEKEGKFLLPQGDLRDVLAAIGDIKALASAGPSFDELHACGLEYSKRLRESESQPPVKRAFTLPPAPVVDPECRMAEFERQKKIILEKFPLSGKAATA